VSICMYSMYVVLHHCAAYPMMVSDTEYVPSRPPRSVSGFVSHFLPFLSSFLPFHSLRTIDLCIKERENATEGEKSTGGKDRRRFSVYLGVYTVL
jgi:hypothetical protein